MGDTDIDSDLAAPVDDARLFVSEIFGPTVQGEGPSCGRRAMFLRLGRCNLDCSWCDTPYTWDWTGKNGTVFDPAVEVSRETTANVLYRLLEHGKPELVVITGGEPMLQRRALQEIVSLLGDAGVEVEIETNGTQRPTVELAATARFNVSPKLAHSGVSRERAIVVDALLDFAALAHAGRAAFKFVVQTVDDLDFVDSLRDGYAIPPRQIWIMPEGREGGQLLKAGALADAVIEHGYNLSPRLHVELWGDVRAR